MILYFILFGIIILMVKHIYEIHKINYQATIEQLQSANSDEIFELFKERKPLLIHNHGNKHEKYNNLSFKQLSQDNPGLIIKDNTRFLSLDSFVDDKQMYVSRNESIYQSLNLKNFFDHIYEPFKSKIHCNQKYLLSLLKGKNMIPIDKNKHNLHLIYQIYGQSKIYIFNPKHKNDIENKSNESIKKYGQKINLTQGLILYIPIEWYYFYECEDESIIGEILSDNYFTVVYNNIR